MVLACVVIHVLARVLPHVLARVLLHVLARVIIHVHDYYSKTCILEQLLEDLRNRVENQKQRHHTGANAERDPLRKTQ